jgi:hypothetical protein
MNSKIKELMRVSPLPEDVQDERGAVAEESSFPQFRFWNGKFL